MGGVGFIKLRVGIIEISKVELFAKIVFGYMSLFFLVKCFHWIHKKLPIIHAFAFYVLLVKILHLEKKHIISTPTCLTLLFQ